MALVYCALYLALIGVLSHLIGEMLPRRWFHFDSPFYRSMEWERGGAVYERIGIRRWKDELPDMSRFIPKIFPKRLSANFN